MFTEIMTEIRFRTGRRIKVFGTGITEKIEALWTRIRAYIIESVVNVPQLPVRQAARIYCADWRVWWILASHPFMAGWPSGLKRAP